MATLQIRDLPEEIYQALVRRAARERRSLAQQAVVELAKMTQQHSADRRVEVLEELRSAFVLSGPRIVTQPPEAGVREDRER